MYFDKERTNICADYYVNDLVEDCQLIICLEIILSSNGMAHRHTKCPKPGSVTTAQCPDFIEKDVLVPRAQGGPSEHSIN